MHAVRHGKHSAAQLLLAAGAAVDARGKHKMSSLAVACHCAHGLVSVPDSAVGSAVRIVSDCEWLRVLMLNEC